MVVETELRERIITCKGLGNSNSHRWARGEVRKKAAELVATQVTCYRETWVPFCEFLVSLI